ncbi:uncharacterized protein LOC106059987 [Biomphalaria glabrata]|uniref:Uncharacterized protein LOC106059987 n=1 Tax=Biomphalaria glabrata TaxID=6526 RepID=A0A9W2YC18_BIOGL|nr:uncharacterized protein LOC106059987 [Biomphalaria glabrata]
MNETNVIIIVAVIAGGLFVIVIVGLTVFLLLQRRRKRSQLTNAPKTATNGRSGLSSSLYGTSGINDDDSEASFGRHSTTHDSDEASGFENNNVDTHATPYNRKSTNGIKVLPKIAAKPARVSVINHDSRTESFQPSFHHYDTPGANIHDGLQTNRFSQTKTALENVYKKLPTISSKIAKSCSDSSIDQTTVAKTVKSLPVIPKKPISAPVLNDTTEARNQIPPKPAIIAKPFYLQTTNTSTTMNTKTSDFLKHQENIHQFVPAIPPKPSFIPPPSIPATFDHSERQAKYTHVERKSYPKISPPVLAKPSSKLAPIQHMRGKDNQGFVSDDSGYTTVDSTVHSVDSSLYLSRKLKQNWEKSSDMRRIHVADSNRTEPYAVIEIFDQKEQNQKTSVPPPPVGPSQLTVANFLLNLNRQNVSTNDSSIPPENFYFELEKQYEATDSAMKVDADLYNSRPRSTPNVRYLRELKETDV